MKKLKLLVSIGLAAIAASVSMGADVDSFSANGNAINPGTNWLVIPGESFAQFQDLQGRAVSPHVQVNFLSCRAYSAAGVNLTGYYITNPPVAFTSNSLAATSAWVPWQSTNGLAANQWITIHHANVPLQIQDEALQISSYSTTLAYITNNSIVPGGWATNTFITTNINVTLATAPLHNINLGDAFYQEVPGPLINVASQGTTTSTTITGPSFTGGRGLPELLVIGPVGTANGTNTIDTANGLGLQ